MMGVEAIFALVFVVLLIGGFMDAARIRRRFRRSRREFDAQQRRRIGL